MKISNVTILSTNLTNNTAKISFTISETTENVNVYLKINDEEYKEIFSNKTNEDLEYTINVSKGVTNLLLKATDSTTEYISEPIQVLLKEEPTIDNLICSYSDSTGKYILNFTLNGDANFKYSIYLKLDANDYIEVLSNQISGEKTIEQVSTIGAHNCILKASDGYDEYTFTEYTFDITNHKPILSKVLVTDITNNGEAYIYYSTKDIESSALTHKLTIGTTETVITPTQVDNFYSYRITGLLEGISNCTISISDGIDIVSSDEFSIEVFSDTTDKKELLRRAKVRYDSAYQQLKDIIMSVVSDLKYDYDMENDLIKKAQDNYKIEYSNFNRIAQQSIDTIGTNKVNVTKQDLETQINDVDNAVDTLETTMNGVFKDGILDESEKRILEENLNIVAKEKVDVDRDYKTLYDNEDLLDPAKTKLQTKYNDFITAHTALVTTINGIVNKAGIIDNTDKANMDTAFENWRVALGDYRNASLEAIDAIAKKKADDSADVVDKKWAEIILDPETGIQMQVGNLTNKVNNVTTKVDDSVKDVQVMYYLSTSETVLEGGEWSDVAPQWEKDKYMWSKTVVTLTNGTVNESDPTCIAGAKGESTYTWIKYADDENGTNMSNDPTDKSYIGFAYNKTTPIESDDASEYMWSLIKGRDGIDGKDGTSITILGSYDTIEELNNAHPDGNNNGDGYIVRGDLYIWQGTEFINVGQIKGEDGIDGKTPYMHIKYSNDGGLTFTPNNGEEAGDYIGLYTDFIEADSTNVAKYTWTKIKGYDGVNAVTYYTWIKYSDNADGTDLYDVPNENTKYIGIATNKPTATESTNKADYIWSLFKGEDGISGTDGIGINNIVEEYYLSTSKETQEGGEWVETPPTWEVGKYMWTRSRIEYSNGTIEYTTPICDSSWEAANNVTTELQVIDERIAKIEVDSDSITSTVSSIQSTVDGFDNRINTNESSITQLSNSITSMVTENDVHSIIQQTPSDIQIGFNGISNNVVINSSGLTVNRGYIACDTLTTPTGHDPVINLFQKTVNGKFINCQIDARMSDGGNYGGAIRLKYDSNSYLLVNDAGVSFFIEGKQVFSFVSNGTTYGAISINESNIGYLEMGTSWITYNNKGLAFDDHIHEIYSLTTHNHDGKYAASSHTHSGYASSSHTHSSISYGSTSVDCYSGSLYLNCSSIYLQGYTQVKGSIDPTSTGSYNLGYSSKKWNQLSAVSVWGDNGSVSDIEFKENIHYLKANNESSVFAMDDEILKENEEHNIILGLTSEDLYNFIKDELHLCEYNYTDGYLGNSARGDFENKLGFIAQDIQDTKVGTLIVGDWEGHLAFNTNNYVSTIGGALQYEIALRDVQIADLEARIEELENKLNQ